jgi:hypothetical protein
MNPHIYHEIYSVLLQICAVTMVVKIICKTCNGIFVYDSKPYYQSLPAIRVSFNPLILNVFFRKVLADLCTVTTTTKLTINRARAGIYARILFQTLLS